MKFDYVCHRCKFNNESLGEADKFRQDRVSMVCANCGYMLDVVLDGE